ncbi:MAG: hypothetical protein GTO45_33015 [Candidatus Aminicenantes bacterium]|nr:hypothetical protein [Candidatus Aminicenantes bacterium]NIM83562.1 hypothetical protein [Candidatus Aminicenantes bacterium]NIN22962.1 hypothetical protein [Candidatus Aminicenantes bacterium]NIN46699.1 hypothetical protein [Candidatus Aminicenantes bacterium]NIN89605.1 hypothetical protein [Candidatus Aminicenantes bacterium]
MLILHIIIGIQMIVLMGLIIVFYFFIKKTNQRIANVEENMTHLSTSTSSQYFPDSMQKQGSDTKDVSEELTLKQNVLKKLISEAEKASQRLEIVEEKIRENKLDKETINKILILVNQGFTPAEIAPKLNIPLGEIELVIKLRKYISAPMKEKL